MNKMNQEQREQLIFMFSWVLSVVAVVVTAGFIAASAYVRWNLNKDFTFLGGSELEALTLGAFGLVAVLVYTHRPHRE